MTFVKIKNFYKNRRNERKNSFIIKENNINKKLINRHQEINKSNVYLGKNDILACNDFENFF